MIFERVTGELKSDDPKDAAKVVFDFFVWQYENAVRNEIAERCDYKAAVAANQAAEQEYKDENQIGFGTRLPYSQYDLDIKQREADAALKNRKDAKILLNFMRDRFLEKFV